MTTDTKLGVVLRNPTLTHAELITLIREYVPDNQPAWYLTTHVTDTCFDVFEKATAATLVTTWTHGRVFWASCEIRWQRAPSVVQNDVLVLSEHPAIRLQGFHSIGTAWHIVTTGKHVGLMAWGSPVPHTAHIRAESRLPKRLRYPSGCQVGQLLLVYYCTPSGVVQFLRLTGVA